MACKPDEVPMLGGGNVHGKGESIGAEVPRPKCVATITAAVHGVLGCSMASEARLEALASYCLGCSLAEQG